MRDPATTRPIAAHEARAGDTIRSNGIDLEIRLVDGDGWATLDGSQVIHIDTAAMLGATFHRPGTGPDGTSAPSGPAPVSCDRLHRLDNEAIDAYLARRQLPVDPVLVNSLVDEVLEARRRADASTIQYGWNPLAGGSAQVTASLAHARRMADAYQGTVRRRLVGPWEPVGADPGAEGEIR